MHLGVRLAGSGQLDGGGLGLGRVCGRVVDVAGELDKVCVILRDAINV